MEKIFKTPPNKTVLAYNLITKLMTRRNLRNFRLRAGAFGILRNGNKILIERHPLSHKYALPGGGIEIGETISGALKREFLEETGIRVKVGKLFFVNENLFTLESEDAQAIYIYYQVTKIGGKLLKNGNGEDTAEVKFINLKELSKSNIQKIFWEAIKEYKKYLTKKP